MATSSNKNTLGIVAGIAIGIAVAALAMGLIVIAREPGPMTVGSMTTGPVTTGPLTIVEPEPREPTPIPPIKTTRGIDYLIEEYADGKHRALLGLPTWFKLDDKYVPIQMIKKGTEITVNTGLISGTFDEDAVSFSGYDDKGKPVSKPVSESWLLKNGDKEITRNFLEDNGAYCDGKEVKGDMELICKKNATVILRFNTSSSSFDATYEFTPGSAAKSGATFSTASTGAYTATEHLEVPQAEKVLLVNGTEITITATPVVLSKTDYGTELIQLRFEDDNDQLVLIYDLHTAWGSFQNVTLTQDGSTVTADFFYGPFPDSFEVDPAMAIANDPSPDAYIRTGTKPSPSPSCATTGFGKIVNYGWMRVTVPDSDDVGDPASRCYRSWSEFLIPSEIDIPAVNILNVTLILDIDMVEINTANCDFTQMNPSTRPSTWTSYGAIWTEIDDGTNYLSDTNLCALSPFDTPREVVIGPVEGQQASADLDSNAADPNKNWFAIGIKLRDGGGETRVSTGDKGSNLKSEDFCSSFPSDSSCTPVPTFTVPYLEIWY